MQSPRMERGGAGWGEPAPAGGVCAVAVGEFFGYFGRLFRAGVQVAAPHPRPTLHRARWGSGP